ALDAGREVRERLGVVCARAFAGQPAGMRVAELGLDLGAGLAFPRPERPLAQPVVDANIEPVSAPDDVGGLPGSREVARVDRVDNVEVAGAARGQLATG